MTWARNVTGIDSGIFRTINGNSDEMIAVGRCMKAGFPCSRVDTTNGRYDAIVDVNGTRLLRIQIKGTSTNSLSLSGGGRSGQQIDRSVKQRTYKYTKEHCDLILGIDGRTGECYIIPIEATIGWGTSKSLSKLKEYRENWEILKQIALIP